MTLNFQITGWLIGLVLVSVVLVIIGVGLLFEALFAGMGDALSPSGAVICAVVGVIALAATWWLWASWYPLCKAICS